MRVAKSRQESEKSSDIRVVPQTDGEVLPAWEQIEPGRYRPRRIRGSFPGRELG